MDFYPEYVKNTYSSSIKRQTTNYKMGKRFKWLHLIKRYTHSIEAHEKMLNIIIHERNANLNLNEIPLLLL